MMATGGEEVLGSNMAFEAFRKHYEELLTAIQEPEVLAAGLYSRGVVTMSLMEKVSVQALPPVAKKMKLLLFVTNQITVDPTTLEKFLEALKNQPSAARVAERLERTYCSLTGQSHRQVQTQSNAPSVTHQLSTSEERLAIFPTPSLHPHPSSAAAHATDAYTSFLKSVYLRQKFPTYGKWHPDTSNAFINLAIIKKQKMSKEEMDHFTKQTIRGGVDDIVHEKESISMDEIGKAKGNMLPKFILVEGAPGVGKSTFAWKLCRKWSKGKLLHQYRLVVLLRLRDKRVRETKSVTDLFYYYNRQIQQTVVEEIQATGGRGVLLLFEGYDELPAKLRTSSSIFLEVITGKELPEATVLVTSRPSASGPLYMECRNFIDQHVEILGFTEKDIQSYFDRNMESSLLQELQQYLTYYPHITTMLYIPLNCAIVAEVYRVNKSSKSLIPKTWTELYSSLLRSLLLRYLDDHPVHQRQSWKSNNFRDLPADVYQRLCEVGTIAYEGILQGQQVIFSDLPSDFNSLGLMQCVPELYVDKVAAESFNFLHLTLQEYMAALHLSEQPVEKQIKLFHGYQQQKHGGFSDGSCTHLQTVLRFLAGLKKFRGYPNSSIHSLLANPGRSHESSLWISLDGLHWMFEATYSNACKAIEVSSVRVDLSRRVTTFDCFALGCCVSHSSCVWMVEFNGCGIGDEGVEMLVRGAMERETKHSGYISEMSMPSNNITGTGLNQLLKMPELQKLRLLDLSGNPLGRGGAVSLLKSPLIPNLEELVLASTEIGVEDCQALSELLPSSPVLQRINIRYNNLPPEAVEPIITALKNCTVLEKLQIGDSQFTLQNCISLGSLTHPPRKLNLQCCHIDDEGAIEVVRLLDQNTVTSLRLGGNPIGVKGASELAIKLLSNTSLIELELRHESIGHEGAQKLIASLSQNSTLERLDLLLKYKSSVDTSEAYRRVQNRIQWWKDPTVAPRRVPRDFRIVSISTRLGGSTLQPHPALLGQRGYPPTVLGHHRGGATYLEGVEKPYQHIVKSKGETTENVKTADYLRGVEVLAETQFIVKGRHSQTFKWEGHGLKLSIPEGAVLSESVIYIKAGLAGQFELPSDAQLVSPMYWLYCVHSFQHPVTLELQHCAIIKKQSGDSSLSFIVAKCSQELPYKFKFLHKGTFSQYSSHGSIDVKQFSIFGLVTKLFELSLFGLASRSYFAQLFYIDDGENAWKLDFIITWNLELCLIHIQQKYTLAVEGPHTEVEFERESISLAIPENGITENGWAITPLNPQVITKQQVDRFKPGQRIPSCQLRIQLLAADSPEILSYKLALEGAKEPFNFLTVTRTPVNYSTVHGRKRSQQPEGSQSDEYDTVHGRKRPRQLEGNQSDDMQAPTLENLLDNVKITNWFYLGVKLGINQDTLDAISKNRSSDAIGARTDMLKEWLRACEDPTWVALVAAMREIGEGNCAKKLEDKFC